MYGEDIDAIDVVDCVFEYYDKYGKRITFDDLIELEDDQKYGIVGVWVNWVGEEVITTTWNGVPVYPIEEKEGPDPLIFETVCHREDRYRNIIRRYSTLDRAIEGHRTAVLQAGGDPDSNYDNMPDWMPPYFLDSDFY